MIDLVRVTNPTIEGTGRPALIVRTFRQDIPPGEPGSLMGHVTLQPGESSIFQIYEGCIVAISKESDHG